MIPVIALALGFLLLLVVTARHRSRHPARALKPVVHRCDFCKEAILLIDGDARTFVRHAGPRPLLGYSVVNACGACAREHQIDGAFSPEGADPSV